MTTTQQRRRRTWLLATLGLCGGILLGMLVVVLTAAIDGSARTAVMEVDR